jgi:hypothetical protein
MDANLLSPNLGDIVSNVWGGGTSWSINGELGIESLSCFSTFVPLLRLQGQIKAWCLPSASVYLSIVKAKCALDLLCEGNLFSDRVNLVPQIFLAANTS